MTTIQSLEDLNGFREQALQKRELQKTPDQVKIIVGLGTPAIAARVHQTLQAIQEFIAAHNLRNVTIHQTGDFGLDSFEPIIQVIAGDQPKVTYARVDPAAVERIMQAHVIDGEIVQDYRINFA